MFVQKLKTRVGQIISFAKEESGSAVLETVIVIAVIIAIAILFNTQLRAYAEKLINAVFSDASVLELVK